MDFERAPLTSAPLSIAQVYQRTLISLRIACIRTERSWSQNKSHARISAIQLLLVLSVEITERPDILHAVVAILRHNHCALFVG